MLSEETSDESVDKLLEFVDEYIKIGGSNTEVITEYAIDQPILIENCMIVSAAAIDCILKDNSFQIVGDQKYCIDRLIVALAGNFATDAIETAIVASLQEFPGVDVAVDLTLVGVDLVLAIKLAHEYYECLLTHSSTH